LFDIITVGSAVIDVFLDIDDKQEEIKKHKKHFDVSYHIGEKALIKKMTVSTGGGGTNTATAFSRLGLKTAWLGSLGNDYHGTILTHQLKRDNITHIGKTKKGNTGYSVIITGLKKDRVIFTHKGINNDVATKDIPQSKRKTRWFYFASMLGKGLTTITQLAIYAKKKNIPYTFNTSSYLAEKGIAELKPILQGCNILILNKREAQLLLKTRQTDTKKLLQELHNITSGIITRTNGPKEAATYDGTTMYTSQPQKGKVIETTGAGDAFAAAFTAAIIKKKDIPSALQWGHANAASVIRHIGAKEKLLTKTAIAKTAAKIKVKKVKV
jgi:ribokinase